MMIFCNNISGTSSNCTIYKFIIILIFLNQIEIKIYRYKSRIWIAYNSIYDIFCSFFISQKI